MNPARRPAQPSPPSSGATAPTPRARQSYRNPQRIQYEPIKFQEARWGRRLGGWAVVAVVVLGALGWYHYLTKPPARVAPTTSTVLTPGPRSTQSTSATEPASRPASQSSAQPAGPPILPDNISSAKPPDDVPRSHPEPVQAPPTD